MLRYYVAVALGAAVAFAATSHGSAETKKQAAVAPPYVSNIAARVKENDAFRRVLYTGARTQLVAMQLPPGTDIGEEKHAHVEQVFVIVNGSARIDIDGIPRALFSGDLVVVPPGSKHNLVNTGEVPLELYTLYAPPNHLKERVHVTRADAEKDTADEAFGNKVR